jgi:hypothetical protein
MPRERTAGRKGLAGSDGNRRPPVGSVVRAVPAAMVATLMATTATVATMAVTATVIATAATISAMVVTATAIATAIAAMVIASTVIAAATHMADRVIGTAPLADMACRIVGTATGKRLGFAHANATLGNLDGNRGGREAEREGQAQACRGKGKFHGGFSSDPAEPSMLSSVSCFKQGGEWPP